MRLTDSQRARQEEFSAFAALEVAPFAADWDREQQIPRRVIEALAQPGYLGCSIPREHAGQGWDYVTFGLLNEALGRFSCALTGVLTVQTMVSTAILKWGSAEQKRDWLRPLAVGRSIGCFALTEPDTGSAVQSLSTRFTPAAEGFVLTGVKKWISCAQFADVILVFGKLGDRPVACIVPRDSAGVSIEPIRDLMGFRAAGLAQIRFEDVKVPAASIVGKPGFALSHVAQQGLHFGRLSTACSALGLLRGCFEEAAAYSSMRKIQGAPAGDLGMLRTLIARMGTDLAAARALCYDACQATQDHLPGAIEGGLVAKYFVSRAVVRAASDAVQVHGAAGCHESSPVARYYRDAKIMEIIEGTTQIHENLLGKIFVDRASALARSIQPSGDDGESSAAGSPPPADLREIARFNRTEAPFPHDATLQGLIEAGINERRFALAVVCDHDKTLGTPSLTYGQVNERANQLAHTLRELGVAPGQVVGVMVERSFAMMIGLLGVLKAGGAYLPIAPDNPPDRVAYFLRDAGVQILLTQEMIATRCAFGGRILNLDDPGLYHGSTADPEIINGPQDLAYVIYTSGSTGAPKGVMIEHRSLVNRLHWMQRAYPIGADDVILQKTPYSYDVSVWELFWWALAGARLCMLKPGGERNPLAIVDTIRRHRVTVLHFVPSMLSAFLQYLEGKPAALEGLASVKRVFASGEALTPSHVRRFNDLWGSRTGARLTNLYGPTEATVDVSFFDCPERGEIDTIPIGRPIDNTRFYVLREGMQTAIGEPGELCIAGVGLARGYLNKAALTAERFTDNPANPGERIYRTGDLAKWRADGTVEYLGREDHQVKIRGLRIELGEIEERIRQFPGISDCVVVVHKHSESIVLLVAYLVCGAEVRVETLKESLRRFLPEYMIPNRFERIESMPVTSSGKADRKALPAIDLVVA